jgi:hypothetical protein
MAGVFDFSLLDAGVAERNMTENARENAGRTDRLNLPHTGTGQCGPAPENTNLSGGWDERGCCTAISP